MSAPWFILTATPEIRLDLLPGELESRGIAVADPDAVREINCEILASRGVTQSAPLPSPSFRPDPERIAATAGKIGSLVETLTSPGVVIGAEFPLAIEDWATAGPAGVFCLSSPGDIEMEEEPPACRRAFKLFDFHRLTTSGVSPIFLNVEGQPWPEIAAALANLMSDSPPAIEMGIELGAPDYFTEDGVMPGGLVPFRVRADRPLNPGVVEELEARHRRLIRQAALDDRSAVLEKERKKLAG